MFERFGKDVRRAVLRACEEEAQALGSPKIEAEHLLLALAGDDGPAGRLLGEWGLDQEGLRAALDGETERSLRAVGIDASDFGLTSPRTQPPRRPRLGASAKDALERTARIAVARKDRHISTSHLLVGILRADLGTVPRALAIADKDRVTLLSQAEGLLA